jgi:hypothetical protein
MTLPTDNALNMRRMKTMRTCCIVCVAYRNAPHLIMVIGFRHKGLETL